MLNLFFNTEILSDQSSLAEQLAHHCFAPIRYLYHGRTIEIWKQTVIEARQSYPEKDWKKTAAAVAFLVPGLLLGIMAKLLVYLDPSAWRRDTAILTFDQDPHPLTGIISLEVSHARLEKLAADIKNRMTDKKVWSDPMFVEQVSAFMEAAYDEMELYYSHLEKKAGGDRDKMAATMQGAYDDEETADSADYTFTYFYDSLTEMYHLARSYASITASPDQRGRKVFHFSPLTAFEEEPFFEPGTFQYRWRELYNSFCQKLDEYDLKDRLGDGRFANWSQPDDCSVDFYGFPDTRPTPLYYTK